MSFSFLHTPPYKKSVGGVDVIYRSQLKANILNNNTYNFFEVIAIILGIYIFNFIISTRYPLLSTSNTHFYTKITLVSYLFFLKPFFWQFYYLC